jgi:hypothetical protein
MSTFAPLLTWAIQMPSTRHAHVRVQNNTVIKNNFNVFAVCIDALNG